MFYRHFSGSFLPKGGVMRISSVRKNCWQDYLLGVLMVIFSLNPTLTAQDVFIRGDSNQDSTVDLSDAIFILLGLFTELEIICPDASDANDDGTIDITDPIFILNFLFRNGPIAPPPGPHQSGVDPTKDKLGCLRVGSTVIDENGGEVYGIGGVLLIVPPGAFSQKTLIHAEIISQNETPKLPKTSLPLLALISVEIEQYPESEERKLPAIPRLPIELRIPVPHQSGNGVLTQLISYKEQTFLEIVAGISIRESIAATTNLLRGIQTSGTFVVYLTDTPLSKGKVIWSNGDPASAAKVWMDTEKNVIALTDELGQYAVASSAPGILIHASHSCTEETLTSFVGENNGLLTFDCSLRECSTHAGIRNGNFESPPCKITDPISTSNPLPGWSAADEVLAIQNFGSIEPKYGKYMVRASLKKRTTAPYQIINLHPTIRDATNAPASYALQITQSGLARIRLQYSNFNCDDHAAILDMNSLKITDIGENLWSRKITDSKRMIGETLVLRDGQCSFAERVFYWDETIGLHIFDFGEMISVRDINESGQVIGEYLEAGDNSISGFLWYPKSRLVSLGLSTRPIAINNNGVIVGVKPFFEDNEWIWRSFVRDPDGRIHILQHPSNLFLLPVDINEQDVVCGYAFSEDERRSFGGIMFLWTREAGVFFVENLAGYRCLPYKINENREIFGSLMYDSPQERGQRWTAYYWDSSHGIIPILFNGQPVSAFDMSNQGDIVGQTKDRLPFVWRIDNGVEFLEISPSFTEATPASINDQGVIAGYQQRPLIVNAVLWIPKEEKLPKPKPLLSQTFSGPFPDEAKFFACDLMIVTDARKDFKAEIEIRLEAPEMVRATALLTITQEMLAPMELFPEWQGQKAPKKTQWIPVVFSENEIKPFKGKTCRLEIYGRTQSSGYSVVLLDGFRFGKVWVAGHQIEGASARLSEDVAIANAIYQQAGIVIEARSESPEPIPNPDLGGNGFVDDYPLCMWLGSLTTILPGDANCDLYPIVWPITWATACSIPTLEEQFLLSYRSKEPSDINVYYVHQFMSGNLGNAFCGIYDGNFEMIAEKSGDEKIPVFSHELGHILMGLFSGRDRKDDIGNIMNTPPGKLLHPIQVKAILHNDTYLVYE